MGLFSKLQNGDTVLKSLKFGNDRPGGGNSGQPYIKNPLIDEPGKLSRVDDDFLLRGGLRAPINAVEDVARLTKYMFDFKSPKGLMFIAKQNLLSRVSVATEASISAGYGNNPSKDLAWTKSPLNQGIYNPLSTILQAGVGFTGTHLNLLGINPFTPMTGIIQGGFLPGTGLVRYEDVVKGKTRLTKKVISEKKIPIYNLPKSVPKVDYNPHPHPTGYKTEKTSTRIPIGQYENRLLYLWEKDMIVTDNAGGTILTYSGGPGSVLGIGKTKIKFADQRTGLNNPLSDTESTYFYKGGNKLHEYDFTPNYTGLLQASIAQGLTYEEIGIKVDGTLGGENSPRLYGPSYPNYTLSKYNPTGQSLTGSGGYQIGLQKPGTEVNYDNLLGVSKQPTSILSDYLNPPIDSNFKTLTTQSDSTYYSPIGDKLKYAYNRQLVTSSVFDDSNQSGNANTWAATNSNGKIIPKYSSYNTLRRDFTDKQIYDAGGGLWDNFNKYYGYGNGPSEHKDGYLADLDKNAGAWKNSSGILTTTNNNAYPGGIAPDFRLVPRKIRGLYSLPVGQQPSKSQISKTNGKIGEDVGEISNTWMTEGGSLSPSVIDTIYYNSNSTHKSSFRESNLLGGKDLIDFRITVIDPRNPNTGAIPLNFRAYIDSFSDSYNADWKGQTYIGRAEQFYKYNSFGRDISLSFKIVADNKVNLGTMYSQLNTLASSLAPTYTTFGYMAGNLHQLTVGDYISNQTGVMNSLSYEIMNESPWEIETGNQLPMYIAVTIKFTPIHNFRPEMKWSDGIIHQFINQA